MCPRWIACPFAAALTISAQATPPTPTLILDTNLIPTDPPSAATASSQARTYVRIGNRVVFHSSGSTRRLWSTDGSPAGTIPLTPSASVIQTDLNNPWVVLPDRVVVTLTHDQVRAVVVTDGTPAGTHRVNLPNPDASIPYYLFPAPRLLDAALGRTVFAVLGPRQGTTGPFGLYAIDENHPEWTSLAELTADVAAACQLDDVLFLILADGRVLRTGAAPGSTTDVGQIPEGPPIGLAYSAANGFVLFRQSTDNAGVSHLVVQGFEPRGSIATTLFSGVGSLPSRANIASMAGRVLSFNGAGATTIRSYDAGGVLQWNQPSSSWYPIEVGGRLMHMMPRTVDGVSTVDWRSGDGRSPVDTVHYTHTYTSPQWAQHTHACARGAYGAVWEHIVSGHSQVTVVGADPAFTRTVCGDGFIDYPNERFPVAILGSKVILGINSPTAGLEPHVAIPCPADVASIGGNTIGDNRLTVDDIVSFLNAFMTNETGIADIASVGGAIIPDGLVTADDLIAFVSSFFAGCP